jgi:hypothetical protein
MIIFVCEILRPRYIYSKSAHMHERWMEISNWALVTSFHPATWRANRTTGLVSSALQCFLSDLW